MKSPTAGCRQMGKLPKPVQTILGNLSDPSRVPIGLDLRSAG
jgi:hypothetical protein